MTELQELREQLAKLKGVEIDKLPNRYKNDSAWLQKEICKLEPEQTTVDEPEPEPTPILEPEPEPEPKRELSTEAIFHKQEITLGKVSGDPLTLAKANFEQLKQRWASGNLPPKTYYDGKWQFDFSYADKPVMRPNQALKIGNQPKFY